MVFNNTFNHLQKNVGSKERGNYLCEKYIVKKKFFIENSDNFSWLFFLLLLINVYGVKAMGSKR